LRSFKIGIEEKKDELARLRKGNLIPKEAVQECSF